MSLVNVSFPYAPRSWWLPETLTGTDGRDFIFGFGGGDLINTLGGNDIAFGGTGDDTLNMGEGDDLAFGGKGDDEISLGRGNDRAFGGRGDDRIILGDGHNHVDGGSGFDTAVAAGGFDDYEITFAKHWWQKTTLTRIDDTGAVIEKSALRKVEVVEFEDYTLFLDGSNNAVFARDDAVNTDEDSVLTIAAASVLANDTDPDGDMLSVVDVSPTSSAGATVTLVGDVISYDPGALFQFLGTGETATDEITYTVGDGKGGFDTATVAITVTGLNDAAEISGPTQATVDENTTSVAQFSTSDVDSETVGFSISGGDDAALFEIDGDGNLSFIDAPDFEAPGDADDNNIYLVEVSATDDEGAGTSQVIEVSVSDVAEVSVVISEIMYNPASSEDDWEWVEIVNTGATTLDLAGWVFDDINSVSQSASNIAVGTVAAGESAILYNADDITAEGFAAAWGEGINLIAVTGWGNSALNNSGDTLSLWSDFASYDGDHTVHANAVATVAYDDAGDWPADDGAASIYLTDLGADANDGTNWALSTDGGATPVETGEISRPGGGNSGADVGSPGGIIPLGDVQITEFMPNPTGSDPATQLVELSGNPGSQFDGYILSIESDPGGANPGDINGATAVSGTFDANGLLVVEIPDLENPSFTLVVTDSFTGSTDTDLDTDDDGVADDTSTLGTVFDAIGVPDNVSDESLLYGAQLGGQDFSFTGDEPRLVFRDGETGDLFAVNDPDNNEVIDINGNAVDPGDFSFDPLTASFGDINPVFSEAPPPAPLSLVINEILADPDASVGDANGDGTVNTVQDEFVEIVNTGTETADLSGVSIFDGFGVRHVFADGTTLAVGAAIVVFGGGAPTGDFGGAQAQTASTGSLGLNNSGDTVTLFAPDGTTVLDEVSYGSEGGQNESLTRSPELTGDFVAHTSTGGGIFSPGTAADGTPFDATRSIAINEIRHNQSGDDDDEFIELFADPGTSLDGVTLLSVSGEFAPGQIDFALDLSAGGFDEDGIFMIARSAISTGTFDAGDLTLPDSLNLFGSPGTYFLVEDFTGAAGDDLDTDNDGTLDTTPWANVLDAVTFIDGDGTLDVNYSDAIVGPDGNFSFAGIAAVPDGSDTYTQLDFGDLSFDTPGELNDPDIDPPVETTLISAIQGTGSASPLAGQVVTVSAIVVGDFQNGDADDLRNLNGFFLQEEDTDQDADPTSSEGIFVFDPTLLADVSVGDRVTVTGTVSEAFGQTQLTASAVTIDEAGAVADVNSMAVSVDLDAAAAISDGSGGYIADLEAYECMLVTFPTTLTVTEAFNLDRFGEIRLTTGDRPEQFTQNNDPDAAAFDQHLQDVFSDAVIYDDGRTTQSPFVINPDYDLDGDGLIESEDGFGMGDTVADLTGVLGFSFSEYRVHSIEDGANTFIDTETRDATPPDLTGTSGETPEVTIASFNVLNFFTTIDDGVNTAGPSGLQPRGADTFAEYERQLDKLITTLTQMNADIYGLVELENEFGFDQNGDGLVAIEVIVDELNLIYGADTWAYVDPGAGFVDTGDAISVGMIYNTNVVSLVAGSAEVLTDADLAALPGDYGTGPVFDGANTNRAPLAATFEYTDGVVTEDFTVAVTHMKSKGGTGTGGDADLSDGAGAFNETRTEGTEALIDWLASFADEDQIILGDFNAYKEEDPIDTMTAAGYTNLEETFDPGSTSFVFDGQTGTLDYAFANGGILDNVTNASIWQINSEEPDLYDYNLELDGNLANGDERDPLIFDGSVPYRSSDHDPILVGLNFVDDVLTT